MDLSFVTNLIVTEEYHITELLNFIHINSTVSQYSLTTVNLNMYLSEWWVTNLIKTVPNFSFHLRAQIIRVYASMEGVAILLIVFIKTLLKTPSWIQSLESMLNLVALHVLLSPSTFGVLYNGFWYLIL